MMTTRVKTVGIVDDDHAVRDSLAALLSVANYRTICCATPIELLEADFKSDLDCLVVDVRLPVISGIEMLRRLAAEGVRIPAVVISGHADAEIDAQISLLDEVWFLSKPCDPQTLLSLLEDAIANREA